MKPGELIILTLIVFACGLIGGFVNSLRVGQGFANWKPKRVSLPGAEEPAFQPGLLVNTGIGGFAAVVSWGLYGPLAQMNVLEVYTAAATAEGYVVSVSSLAAAALVGYGGTQWLSAEVDKKTSKAATSAMSDRLAAANANAKEQARATEKMADTAADLTANLTEVAKAPDKTADTPHLAKPTEELAANVQQVKKQSQKVAEHFDQMQQQAQQIKAAETPADVLNRVQDMAQKARESESTPSDVLGSAEDVAQSAEEVTTIVEQTQN
jgi:hypothetical protein